MNRHTHDGVADAEGRRLRRHHGPRGRQGSNGTQQRAGLILVTSTCRNDGFQVLEELHKEPELAVTPFIFLTARTDRSDLRAA